MHGNRKHSSQKKIFDCNVALNLQSEKSNYRKNTSVLGYIYLSKI